MTFPGFLRQLNRRIYSACCERQQQERASVSRQVVVPGTKFVKVALKLVEQDHGSCRHMGI